MYEWSIISLGWAVTSVISLLYVLSITQQQYWRYKCTLQNKKWARGKMLISCNNLLPNVSNFFCHYKHSFVGGISPFNYSLWNVYIVPFMCEPCCGSYTDYYGKCFIWNMKIPFAMAQQQESWSGTALEGTLSAMMLILKPQNSRDI